MNTSEIKKFATAARRLLLQGVRNKLLTLGFNENGQVTLAQLPVLAYNDTNFNGRIIPGKSFYYQWTALQRAINEKGINNICEEAAYTWFNRLVAIRILQKQEKNLIRNVLDFVDDSRTPAIVHDARHGIINGVSAAMRGELDRLLLDDTKTTEQFSILISAFCEDTPLLSKIFGRINDYTELLLPNDILNAGGFIDLLNNSEYITDDDYLQTELIGWLYQFYISEKKDEVFEMGQWSADDIPAGTQIFTPNWIVKYMVQNTLGRIYLDKHPDLSFKDDLKYLVEQNEDDRPKYDFEKIEDLRCADLSSGSGHILVEFFDLLFRLYEEEWYDSRTAIENIFKKNLVGVDLDTRAKQLSTFTLMLKACQKDETFANAEIMPLVLDMPNVTYGEAMITVNSWFASYGVEINTELANAFKLIANANELGSIMKFDISEGCREAIKAIIDSKGQTDEAEEIVKALLLIIVLSDKYSAICMNPPYMAAKHMDDILSNYATENYPSAKNDLFSVFMDVAYNRLQTHAKYGMINMQAWMYNKYFTTFRESLLKGQQIDSLLHLGPRTFDELSGEIVQNAAFVISKHLPIFGGTFYKLVSGENCSAKENLFKSQDPSIIFKNVDQSRFSKIKLSPMGSYWASDKIVEMFENNQLIEDVTSAYQGLSTAANDRFIRNWHEVDRQKIGFNISSREESITSEKKWFPINKGGGQRKWYGNQTEVINWENDGHDIRNYKGAVLRADECHFRSTITWNMISGTYITFRYFPKGFVLNNASNAVPVDKPESLLALLQSKLSTIIANILNATTNLSNGVVARFPLLTISDESLLGIVHQSISTAKQDWDIHETSWNFEGNPLISIFKENGGTLKQVLDYFIKKWTDKFFELHENEEELNRKFIEIYGLQNELSSEVPLDEVTILQQKEIKIENGQIKWDKSVLVKQLISYAMGCWMGRYRLDKPSLNIAHPNPSAEELATYEVNGKTFDIDDDGIVPLMDEESPFADNAVSRMKDFVSMVFGTENLAENLNYIRECLGMTLEKYFLSGFWKDHLARYQKRPIYWLFQSNKKNPAFQVLVYMHRMDAYSCEKIRTYLLSYIDYLKQRINQLEQNEGTLSPAETRKLIKMKDNLKECLSYEERLHHVANQQIAFDLDDGVKVNYAKFGDVLAAIS
jgi:hypothetical protein